MLRRFFTNDLGNNFFKFHFGEFNFRSVNDLIKLESIQANRILATRLIKIVDIIFNVVVVVVVASLQFASMQWHIVPVTVRSPSYSTL